MGGQVNNYNFGGDGVNIVKDPLQMGDGEASQLQNAELVPDQTKGGQGALSKRGGLIALTSALAGSILGMISLPLQTTYTQTLLCGLGSADSDTWVKTSDGAAFTEISTPLRPGQTQAKYATPLSGQSSLINCARRGVAYKAQIYYMGDDYTIDTSNPPISSWDGTTALEVFRVPVGPNSDGTEPTVVTDMLAANGKIYFAVAERAASAAFHGGRVMCFDPRTNSLTQVANAVGTNTGDVTGHSANPTCLAWFMGRLWMGLHASNSGSADVGAVYWCYPDTDATWTADVTNLNGKPNTLLGFNGNLYVGTSISDGLGTITKRTSSTGAWADVDTQAQGHYMMLREFNSKLYCVRYFDDAADGVDIMESSDGTTWASVRDVYATDSGSVKIRPTGAAVLGSDLFYAFEPVTISDTGTGGFILRLRAGTWSKVLTGNISGPMVVLTERT